MKFLPAATLLVVAVILVYANSLHAPFVFDDVQSITENTSIRRLASTAIWSPPPGVTVSGRPIVNASLALNYALGSSDVRGYHLVNVAIHALAALVLFGLLRRTFVLPRLRARFGSDATWVAFAGALIWAFHPLHTESVTYVVQRAESLMGLFYLLTLHCFVRSTDAPQPRLWQTACGIACALGMATKEVMVSAPLVVLLYDRILVAGSLRECWRRRRGLHATLAATWFVLVVLGWQSGDRAGTAGYSSGVVPWHYALTQCRAVVHYLQLAVWPHPLVFDYGPYAPPQMREFLPFIVAGAVMLAAAVWLLRRWPAAGFAGAALLLILAPTSSVMPIATEPMAEHRMYLPLAAIAALAVAGLHRLGQARGLLIVAAVAVGLGVSTFQRNAIYRTERTLWSATVAGAPRNPRAHSSLAWALFAEREFASAESHFKAALALRPDYVDARHGLARIMEEGGRVREAGEQYRAILRSTPGDFVAHNALGNLAFQLHDLPAAAIDFENAVRARPGSAPAHNNLGCVLYELGDLPAAKTQLETALRLAPDYAEAHYNLGNVLVRQNRLSDARAVYGQALRLAPDYAVAHAHLGVVLQNLGEPAAAIWHYREALRLQPDLEFVRKNLESLPALPPQQRD
jgi:tetratricopeptide (TPR) repeat protein